MIKRNKPLPRSASPIARGKRPNRVNKARKAKNFARAYESEARLEWFAAHPCVCCGTTALRRDNAHLPSKSGAGRKGDARFIVPLCRGWAGGILMGCHVMQGNKGLSSLNAYRVDLLKLPERDWYAVAEQMDAEWRQIAEED